MERQLGGELGENKFDGSAEEWLHIGNMKPFTVDGAVCNMLAAIIILRRTGQNGIGSCTSMQSGREWEAKDGASCMIENIQFDSSVPEPGWGPTVSDVNIAAAASTLAGLAGREGERTESLVCTATANNHQLPSSSSSSAASSSVAEVGTSTTLLPAWDGAAGAVTPPAEAAQLVDNKIHDKLHEPQAAGDVTAPQPVRQKRADIFSDNVLTNNYQLAGDGGRRWNADGTPPQPRITEEVLLVSNLTEERAREENELLEHLNRDRFLTGGRIKLDNGGDELAEAASGGSPRGGGSAGSKKGRRRKGHKKHKHKKIKLLPVTLVGVPVDEDGRPDAGIIEGLTGGADGAWSLKLAGGTDRAEETLGKRAHPPAVEIGGPATSDGTVVEMVDVWKETTMPPPALKKEMPVGDRRPATVSGFPPPPVLVGDGHLVFGSAGGMQILPAGANRPAEQRTQRKREKQQRKQLQKDEQRKVRLEPPLPPLPSGVTASSASTVTFPAEDHKGTETVSVARVIISGDLSCMKDDFIPAPAIANGDIKYLRNDLYGLEHSFLEAEYHCRMGYRLRLKDGQTRPNTIVTSTGALPNANLVCRKSRWIGKRPACVRIKPSPPPSPDWATLARSLGDGNANASARSMNVNPCGKDHRCPQACHRVTPTADGPTPPNSLNRTTVCSCYKGFKMVNHRCVVYEYE
uniref:Sushi domain-containing protein n=1 Tax=Anopheles epiroticus TaxID=199890 RepID=A0A182PMJ1_9DIPT